MVWSPVEPEEGDETHGEGDAVRDSPWLGVQHQRMLWGGVESECSAGVGLAGPWVAVTQSHMWPPV